MSDDKQLPEKEREEAVNSNEIDIPNNTGYEKGGGVLRENVIQGSCSGFARR